MIIHCPTIWCSTSLVEEIELTSFVWVIAYNIYDSQSTPSRIYFVRLDTHINQLFLLHNDNYYCSGHRLSNVYLLRNIFAVAILLDAYVDVPSDSENVLSYRIPKVYSIIMCVICYSLCIIHAVVLLSWVHSHSA